MLDTDPIIVVHLSAAGLTGAVAWRTLRHRHVPGARAFGVTMVAAAVWALLGALGWIVESDVAISLLYRLEWTATGAVGVSWLAFGLAYSGRGDAVTPRRVAAVSVIPVCVALTALCHGLLIPWYATVLGGVDGAVALLWAVEGTWPVVTLVGRAYIYLLAGVGSVLLLETLFDRPHSRRSQALVLLVVGPPWVLNVVHLVVDFQYLDPTILGFVVSGLAGLSAVGRSRLFEGSLARNRIVEQSNSGVLVYGRDGRIFDVNPRAADVLDHPSPGLVGSDVRSVLAASSVAADVPADAPLFADGPGDGGPDASDSHPPAADGGTTPLPAVLDRRTFPVDGDDGPAFVEARVSELGDSGGRPLSWAVRLYDVTDRERRERELRRKNEFLDAFAGVVSHDVATPLSVIENKARLIEMTDDTDHAADIYEETERVQALIDDLRTLAQQGQEVGETVPVDVESVAREAWESLDHADATLTVTGTKTVEADRQRLRQLFANLLTNAVEHGVETGEAPAVQGDGGRRPPEDPAPLSVTVGVTETGFFVADDGPGIPEDERDRVFEHGVSGDPEGTGMGLAIVRRIVEGHGWSITVSESEAGGARFDVRTETA